MEHQLKNNVDENSCWLCHGEKRVEWSSLGEELDDGSYEIVEGVYDPCPECENKPNMEEI